MTCFYCGTDLPAGAMFCGECGRPVNTRGGRKPSGAAAKVAEPRAVEPISEPVAESALEPAIEPEPLSEPGAAAVAKSVLVTEPNPQQAIAEVAEPTAESEQSLAEAGPEVEPAVQRQAELVLEAKPEPAPDLKPEPAPASAIDRCAQCGAPLAASDIFCPECGFVRQRVSPRSRPSDTNILDPFPWGLPRSTEPVAVHHHASEPVVPVASVPEQASGPEHTSAPDATASLFAEIADVSETRLVPRGPRGDRFVLQFSTGESVSVSGSGLIGRNPVAEPGEYFETLVSIVDPGRSVSKTHLEFGQDGTSFWVSDRYSGNGTVVREPDNEPRRCDAGKRYRVGRGTRVEIGEQFFIVS